MKRSVFLSTFLFAAVLSPITLYGNDCAPPADARLAILELRVESFHGENVIEGFDPSVFSYDVRFPESESVGVLWVRTKHPSQSIEVQYDGMPVKLVGQSVAKLDVPLGSSELTIDVATRGPMPDSQTYVVRVERVPVFACTEQGIREAIARGGGPIYFDCDEPTTVLTEAEIVIDNDVILDGEGNLIVDAGGGGAGGAGGADGAGLVPAEIEPKVNGAHRVFSIPEGVTAELIGFTVTGGSTDGDGGGILNAGTFALRNSTVSGNSADRAGGVASLLPGTLTVVASTVSGNTANLAAGIGTAGPAEITDTTVSSNTALVSGGGVGIAMGGTLTLTGSVVEGNYATQLAGGIGSEADTTSTLNNTTVSGNEAGNVGGGISNGGIMILNDSDVSQNSATEFHGGINNDGVLTLNSSTVSENSADIDGGGLGNQGTVMLNNSTVSDNTAGLHGGGLANSGTLTLSNSTVSGNEAMVGGGGGIFTNSGTITLTDTSVSGNAANNTGGGIWVFGGALTLSGSTVSANTATEEGGGINNRGTLTLANSVVSGNTARFGGGIRNEGQADVVDTTVAGNNATQAAGGITNRPGATMTLTRCTVQANSAAGNVGGISNTGGTLTVNDTIVSGNEAGGEAGGIRNTDGTLTMTNSTVSDNAAQLSGGGLSNFGYLELNDSDVLRNTSVNGFGGGIVSIEPPSTIVLNNTTVSGNSAHDGGGGIGTSGLATLVGTTVSGNTSVETGGGIANAGLNGVLTLINSTVSGNAVTSAVGGGIGSSATMTVLSTTISQNTAAFGATGIWNGGSATLRNTIVDGDCQLAAPVDSLGGNIESPGNTCLLIPGIDLFNVPPAQLGLGPLANNGGPTETQALAPFSVALDRISEPECVDGNGLPLLTDQRGVPRPQGPACDSGAFELGDGPPPMGACINDADRMTYESLEYIDSDGMLFTCIDAAAAIGSNCVFGSAQSEPPLEGCAAEAAAVLACFPNCPEDVIETLGICVALCAAEATGLSSSCASCYGEATACGVAWCASLCVVDIDFPPCVSCRIENGCIPGFDTCSGLPGDIDCSGTGGTGGSGGTGGTGGTGGSGGIPGVEYTQNFESLDQMSPTALGDDGWLIFGQVFDGSGTLKFDYGPFPAPNATVDPSTTFFSAIVTAEGGLDQGAQQLSIYNDYNCCDPPNQGHFNGTDRVTSLVFQEPFSAAVPISAGEVGKTVTFSFDARRGNINDPAVPGCAGTPNPPCDSTANAYINTLDPNAGFALTNNITEDTTNLPETWARYSIELEIDPSLVGQILQFGFANTASSFEPSGVFYDNVLVVFKAP